MGLKAQHGEYFLLVGSIQRLAHYRRLRSLSCRIRDAKDFESFRPCASCAPSRILRVHQTRKKDGAGSGSTDGNVLEGDSGTGTCVCLRV